MSQSTQTPLHFQSLSALGKMLENKEISSVELTQTLLERIKTHQNIGAYLNTNEEYTLAQAKNADSQRTKGNNVTPLTGIPIAHKDVFVTRDFPTTAASKMLENYISPFDADAVCKLNNAGMVTLGKLNCDEFAMGGTTENSAFMPTLNPWDTSRIPGGSSGGSAAAVAAGLTPVATGTDTGGSIRQPSAFNNITGIKPTYGRCSRYGMIALASSFDQAGPMAHSALDCAMLLQHMAGFDERDSTSIERPVENFTAQTIALRENATPEQPLKGLRIGLPQEYFGTSVQGTTDPHIQQITQEALMQYEALGAKLVDITLPHVKLAVPVYYVLTNAEASSNLSKLDGMRYGYRAKGNLDLEQTYDRSRSEAFGIEVKRRILSGAYVLSHGYYDAYYLKAQRIRRLIAEDFKAAFTTCDIIAAPVTPTIAWKLGEKIDDPLANYLADIFTLPANLAGLPAISVPSGFASHMPVGLQLLANYWQEGELLHTVHAFQQVTDWHLQHPAGY